MAAWAVAFLGAWLGAVLGGRLRTSAAGLAAIAGGALIGATVGLVLWIRFTRGLRGAGRAGPPTGERDEPRG
jgi:hypothetical protein